MVPGFSMQHLDPGPNYIDCISEVWTRDPIKIYEENQYVVLNTIFAQNHQYIYFVLKQITNSLYISLLLGQNQNVVLNTIFTQNHHFFFNFVLKKITNSIYIYIAFIGSKSLYFAFATTFRPPLYISIWSRGFQCSISALDQLHRLHL